jgi:hypothetical protein
MANTVIGASVEVEFESIGQVRKAIKEATSDLLRMQEAFGKTSPQAIDAARRVAELKDRINDAKEQADLFDPGNKFKAFSNAASQVAAGFSAVQGAMALVGSESDDLQKTLVKVQGAMALSQGLSQIGDLGKAFDELKIVGVRAFTALKTAIGSTGIGLLVIALGAIVAYWDDIKAAVSGVSEEQKKLNKESEKNLQVQKEKLDAIGSQENILKLQGKSEKDILKLKISQTDAAIKAAEINIKNSIETQKAQVAAAKRNKEILQGLIAFVSLPITTVLKGIDLIGQAVGKNFDLYGKFTGGLASLVFDPEETKEKGEADIKAQQKALDDLKNQRAGFQLQINDIDKKGNEKRTADNKKNNDDINKANEAAAKVLDDARRAKLTERQREEEDAIRAFEERKKALQAAGKKDFTSIEEQKELELKAIRDKYKAIQDEADQKIKDEKLAKEKEEAERLKKAHENTLKMVEEQNQALINAEIELQNQRFNAASAGLDLLQSLAGENEKIANAIFAVQKGLEIARIVTDTARGIVAAKAGLAAVPPFIGTIPNPAFVLAAASAVKQIAGLKIAAGVSIAQIAAASINKFKKGAGSTPGGGPGPAPPPPPSGTTAPLTPALSPAVQGQALNAEAINNLGNTSMRAYVLNSDIQNNDQRNAYLQRNARIG